MTDAQALMALAGRCEKASGPDRELDTEIRCAVFAPAGCTVELSPINGAYYVANGVDRGGRPKPHEWRGVPHLQRVGEFTASLDAAMTLVPDGWVWSLNTFGEPNASASAYVLDRDGEQVRPAKFYIATPALALCAAALRARATLQSSVEQSA